MSCYLGDTLGAGGFVEKVARSRVRCAWAKFMELSDLSLILTARRVKVHLIISRKKFTELVSRVC